MTADDRTMYSDSELLTVALDQIDAHPANVRDSLGDEDLLELAESIRSVGLLQPLVVARKPDGRYEILAGHRRFAALTLTSQRSVACVVRTKRPEHSEALELMLVENLHRRALNPIEEAKAYRTLGALGKSQHDIALQVGVSAFTVASRLALLDLPEDAQQQLIRKELSLQSGYAMAVELRRQQRRDEGKADRGRRRSGESGIQWGRSSVPYFNKRHPLAEDAYRRCAAHGHARVVQIGPACGACWEQTIRDDATGTYTEIEPDADAYAPPLFMDGSELCAQVDPDIFHVEKGGSTREAKLICGRCPLQSECLDYALDTQQVHGVWGGTSPQERKAMIAARADEQVAS